MLGLKAKDAGCKSLVQVQSSKPANPRVMLVSRAGLVAVRLIENTQVIDFSFATIAQSASKSVSWRHYGDSDQRKTQRFIGVCLASQRPL